MYKVYIHVFPNNKKYVGITSRSLQERWCDGKGYSGFVRKAIDKYGWENTKHFVYKQELTEEQAKLKEKELIAKYKTMDSRYGYNLTAGGDGSCGFHQPEHVKKAVAEANSKRVWSKESRQKASQSKVGKKFSEEHKRKIGEARKGKPGVKYTEEMRQRVSKQFKGKPFTQEHKDKISAALKGRKRVVV